MNTYHVRCLQDHAYDDERDNIYLVEDSDGKSVEVAINLASSHASLTATFSDEAHMLRGVSDSLMLLGIIERARSIAYSLSSDELDTIAFSEAAKDGVIVVVA